MEHAGAPVYFPLAQLLYLATDSIADAHVHKTGRGNECAFVVNLTFLVGPAKKDQKQEHQITKSPSPSGTSEVRYIMTQQGEFAFTSLWITNPHKSRIPSHASHHYTYVRCM